MTVACFKVPSRQLQSIKELSIADKVKLDRWKVKITRSIYESKSIFGARTDEGNQTNNFVMLSRFQQLEDILEWLINNRDPAFDRNGAFARLESQLELFGNERMFEIAEGIEDEIYEQAKVTYQEQKERDQEQKDWDDLNDAIKTWLRDTRDENDPTGEFRALRNRFGSIVYCDNDEPLAPSPSEPSAPSPSEPSAPSPLEPSAPLPSEPSAPSPSEPSEPSPSEPSDSSPSEPSEPSPSEPSEPSPSEPSEPSPSEPSAPSPSEPSDPSPSEPSAPSPSEPSDPSPSDPSPSEPSEPSPSEPSDPSPSEPSEPSPSEPSARPPSEFEVAKQMTDEIIVLRRLRSYCKEQSQQARAVSPVPDDVCRALLSLNEVQSSSVPAVNQSELAPHTAVAQQKPGQKPKGRPKNNKKDEQENKKKEKAPPKKKATRRTKARKPSEQQTKQPKTKARKPSEQQTKQPKTQIRKNGKTADPQLGKSPNLPTQSRGGRAALAPAPSSFISQPRADGFESRRDRLEDPSPYPRALLSPPQPPRTYEPAPVAGFQYPSHLGYLDGLEQLAIATIHHGNPRLPLLSDLGIPPHVEDRIYMTAASYTSEQRAETLCEIILFLAKHKNITFDPTGEFTQLARILNVPETLSLHHVPGNFFLAASDMEMVLHALREEVGENWRVRMQWSALLDAVDEIFQREQQRQSTIDKLLMEAFVPNTTTNGRQYHARPGFATAATIFDGSWCSHEATRYENLHHQLRLPPQSPTPALGARDHRHRHLSPARR